MRLDLECMRRIWRLIGKARWPSRVASAADTTFAAVQQNEFFCERVFFALGVFFRFVADRLIEVLRPQ